MPDDMPMPTLGSYQLLGLRDDVCFDRFGRYGPYGLGYSEVLGGIGHGNDTESSGNEQVWSTTGRIDYRTVDWADAQQRCYTSNEHRYRKAGSGEDALAPAKSRSRTAIVVRCYEGFKWTPMAILNFRAMITELSLKTGGEYSVHLLMQVRDTKLPLWAVSSARKQYLNKHVPTELQGLVTLWSESRMKLVYPKKFPRSFRNPSGSDIHSVFRSPHLPLQIFAKEHPEYEFFWNWEMDVRVIGNYYELLDRISKWSDSRSRDRLWEHNERYYIPALHGSWDSFGELVAAQARLGKQAVLGPVKAPWRKKLSHEEIGGSILPADCLQHHQRRGGTCGVDEPTDLITLNPIFDTRNSGWFFAQDVTGYDKDLWDGLPRRASVVTVNRYSRRLLLAMHEEVGRYQHSMFAEMFPATVAFHHGFKAVYAPHPIYINRLWEPASEVDRFFNSGERHSTSGMGGPFSLGSERVHTITSWYYLSHFPQELWRRWLGYPGREGHGGVAEESRRGRMCLRSMLLHPVKREHPSE